MRPYSPHLRVARRASLAAVTALPTLFLGALSPCAGQAVSGTVVADGSGFPLPGAHVALQSLDGARSVVVAVDATGLFLVTAPVPGCYRLSVVFGDDVTPAADLSLAAGDTASLHLSLADPDEVAGAAPTPVGGVTGRVVGAADGRPVAGASISVSGVDGHTVTNAEGRFHVPGVRPGILEITVERAGYLPLADSVEVEADDMLETNVALQPEAGVAHRVLLFDMDLRNVRGNRPGTAVEATPPAAGGGYCPG